MIKELMKYRNNLQYKTREEVEEWYEDSVKHLSHYGTVLDKDVYQDHLKLYCLEYNKGWLLGQIQVIDDILRLCSSLYPSMK